LRSLSPNPYIGDRVHSLFTSSRVHSLFTGSSLHSLFTDSRTHIAILVFPVTQEEGATNGVTKENADFAHSETRSGVFLGSA